MDRVNHPEHYKSLGGIECIDYIESLGLGEGFELGNAIKYIARAGKKNNARQDLEKAIWYINRYIEKYINPLCSGSEDDNAHSGNRY